LTEPDGLAVAEGPHLLAEALKSGIRVAKVLVAEECRVSVDVPAEVVSGKVFRDLAATETSQGVIALVEPRVWALENLLTPGALLVALDRLQDPGNVGTIIRSAEAFGASGVVLLKGSAHPWSPKVMRASAGSVFRMPLVCGVADPDPLQAFGWLAAAGESQTTIDAVDFKGSSVVWIGNEGAGVSELVRKRSKLFRIPTETVESLNAAVAASVILYEASRQRRSVPS
jgi:TrmH family RNA methyltransferase